MDNSSLYQVTRYKEAHCKTSYFVFIMCYTPNANFFFCLDHLDHSDRSCGVMIEFHLQWPNIFFWIIKNWKVNKNSASLTKFMFHDCSFIEFPNIFWCDSRFVIITTRAILLNVPCLRDRPFYWMSLVEAAGRCVVLVLLPPLIISSWSALLVALNIIFIIIFLFRGTMINTMIIMFNGAPIKT